MAEKRVESAGSRVSGLAGLEALLSRPVTHELVSHGEEIDIGGRRVFCVRSRGMAFPMMECDELELRVAG